MAISAPDRATLLLDTSAAPLSPRPARSSRRRRIRIVLLVAAALLIIDYGLSLALESGWLRRSLTFKLEAAFGRTVQVSSFSFSLFEGPRLEANYVTVSEDPRFGHEYFLRADQVTVSPRWTALFRGKFEPAALSISRPSLNLVRLPNGEWNLESWLPHLSPSISLTPVAGRPAPRPVRIDVSGGRIDFKEGENKLPFAFVGVNGSVEQASSGSWRLNLHAQPFRSAVALQQAGELTLNGIIGGTSSRLRPASLELDWNAASLSDVLRLFRGYDYGIRGLLSLQLKVQSHGYDWNFSAASQFRRLHRWDLPLRDDDPAANLDVQATWHPSSARLELTHAIVEMPRSSIEAAGVMTFTPAAMPQQASIKDEHLEITSPSIVLADALSWYRAFHRNVADLLEVHGSASARLTLSGWPPRIIDGQLASAGAVADGGSAPVQMRMEKAAATFSSDSIILQPVVFSVGGGNSALRLQASIARDLQWHSRWKLNGRTPNVRSLFDAAEALGFNLPPGWLLSGPAECDLQWSGRILPALREPSGTINLNGLKIQAPFLNHDITRVKASIALSPLGDNVQILSANAFATDWRGSLRRTSIADGWNFTLSASDLSASEMDRWLNPQRRENMLDRLLPFLASEPESRPMPSWLRARGTIEIGSFSLSSFQFRKLGADAFIEGRRLRFTNARAGFYGGALSGSMDLDLAQNPSYEIAAQFQDVNLGLLAAHTFSLADLFAGAASGTLHLAVQGLGRDALIRSLSCRGNAEMADASYRGIDLQDSIQAASRQPGVTIFPRAAAEFSCADGRVNFSRLYLQSRTADFDAAGYVDFQRRMGFQILPIAGDPPPQTRLSTNPRSVAVYRLSGSLSEPQLLPATVRTTVRH